MNYKNIGISVILSLIFFGCGGSSTINNNDQETEFTDTYVKAVLKLTKESDDGITDSYTIKEVRANQCNVLPINLKHIVLNSKEEREETVEAYFSPSPCYTNLVKIIYDYSQNNLPPVEKTFEVKNPQYNQLLVTKIDKKDPLYPYQWYLTNNPVDYGYVNLNHLNINVENAWNEGFTGKNIHIALVGDGIDMFHPDLSNNIDMAHSYNYITRTNNTTPWGKNEPSEAIETGIAGIIVAEANNGIGIKGIAYNAKLINYKVFDKNSSNSDYLLSSLIKNIDFTDIYLLKNISSKNIDLNSFEAQLKRGVLTGRNGLGSVYIMGVGNKNKNAQFNKLLTVDKIIPVGSIENNGKKASYSDYGTNIFISGLSGETINNPLTDQDKIGVVTTDLAGNERGMDKTDEIYNDEFHFNVPGNENYDYTDKGWGSDYAAAMVGGVIALMLEANPSLTYREVKVILARSANTSGLITNWIINAKGHKYSKNFGFGLVDAFKAVEMAKYFAPLPKQEEIAKNIYPNAISNDGSLEYGFNIDNNLSIENVKISLTFDHSNTPYVTDVYTRSGRGDNIAYYKLYRGDNNISLSFDSNTSNVDVNIYNSNNELISSLVFNDSSSQVFNLPETDTYKIDLKVVDTNTTKAQEVSWHYSIVTPHPNASFDQLNISLISPAGTPCELLNAYDDYNGSMENETFMCYPFLDENSKGEWKIKVSSQDSGEFKINNLNIKIIGH